MSTRKRGSQRPSRRAFLGLAGAAAASSLHPAARAQTTDAIRDLGETPSEYGRPSAFEDSKRWSRAPDATASSSNTPLADLEGIVTPSGLHFERHHTGVPAIDPDTHRLTIHGLVDRPLVFTMDDLVRMPSVSRFHFIECSGNSAREWSPAGAANVQLSHGLASCSEWTGVLLADLLDEVGVKPEASWVVAEGADAGLMSRSVPLERALDDVMIAYGQNGEAVRPEQGYPLRLLVPGCEGSISVKWLRRLEVAHMPSMARDETSKYTDLLPDGKARQFTLVMDAKSVITRPSGEQKLDRPGFCEIRGLAWSGRGAIRRVEVSTDGGDSWADAEIGGPRHAKAFTRFRSPWRWEGGRHVLMSRATDDTGYVQPTLAALLEARGRSTIYHNNRIKAWEVQESGEVTNVEA